MRHLNQCSVVTRSLQKWFVWNRHNTCVCYTYLALIVDPFFRDFRRRFWPSRHFPLDFLPGDFNERTDDGNNCCSTFSPFFAAPLKCRRLFEKSVLYGRQEDNFPSNYQLQKHSPWCQPGSKRRRKIRTLDDYIKAHQMAQKILVLLLKIIFKETPFSSLKHF